MNRSVPSYTMTWAIFGVTAVLVMFGLIMVFSASAFNRDVMHGETMWYFFARQALFVGMGLVFMLCCFLPPVKTWEKLAFPALIVAVALLAMCHIPPIAAPQETGRGTFVYRWISLPGINIRFQPSEVAKLMIVIYLAGRWGRKLLAEDGLLRRAWPQMALCALPVAMILREPDKSTALFISTIILCMWFLVSNKVWRVAGGVVALVALGFFAMQMSAYSIDRWERFRNSDLTAIYQLCQALIAYNEGSLMGVGLGAGQRKLGYLPAQHTDMIYAVIGEEVGLLGSVFVIGLFSTLIVLGCIVASRCLNPVAALLALGITLLLGGQALLNMLVATMLVPTTGLCLPFISYGGSSLVICMGAIGILMRVSQSVEAADAAMEREAT